MAQADHERSLVSELDGRPFRVVGVNADFDPPERVLARAHELGLTWRSFQNGSNGLAGPITRLWNVRTLPTTYLVDHRGVIVRRWIARRVPPDELRSAVLKAVRVAEESE